jgi:membrane protease YdiL (CAAX protease family)
MHLLSLMLDIVLACYVAWEVFWFNGRYRELKQEIAKGETGARTRIYYRALVFEWVSALLALLALGFDWDKLNPKALALSGSSLIQLLSPNGSFDKGAALGIFAGVAIGTLAFIVGRIRANRRSVRSSAAPVPRWRKLLPDFSALLPVSTHERLLWAAVAVSAGICEEIVFRGWLLATLHNSIGLVGTGLILVAAVMFGLAHAYQRTTGMLLTALAGVLFCVLYVETGSLLMPILLHIAVDVRFAVLPAPRGEKVQASYA